jgi:hypothetical protein
VPVAAINVEEGENSMRVAILVTIAAVSVALIAGCGASDPISQEGAPQTYTVSQEYFVTVTPDGAVAKATPLDTDNRTPENGPALMGGYLTLRQWSVETSGTLDNDDNNGTPDGAYTVVFDLVNNLEYNNNPITIDNVEMKLQWPTSADGTDWTGDNWETTKIENVTADPDSELWPAGDSSWPAVFDLADSMGPGVNSDDIKFYWKQNKNGEDDLGFKIVVYCDITV